MRNGSIRTAAVIQARLGSTRFPRKVLEPIIGVPALEMLVTRLARAPLIDEIILAIPETTENDALEDFANC